jgi:hypothetical protein
MSSFIKTILRRNARKLGRWLTSEENLPRLRATRDYLLSEIGDANAVNESRCRHKSLIHGLDKNAELAIHERKFYSQFGEDGLLLYFFDKIGAPNKSFIEFGIEDGHECCAANLAINFGWKGLYLEGDPNQAKKASEFYHERHGIDPEHVQIRSHFITRENVNELFTKYGYTGEIDLLSIDIDGVDYWIWEAIECVKPRLIIAEYNAVFGAERSITVPYSPSFDRYDHDDSGMYFGISLKAAHKLATKKGYVLCGCESSGANSFFIRKDLAEKAGLATFTPEEAFYPCAPRVRTMTPEEQWNKVKHLPFEEI